MEQIRRGMTEEEYDRMHMTGMLQKVIEAGRIQISAIPYFDA